MIKTVFFVAVIALGLSSCEKVNEEPTELKLSKITLNNSPYRTFTYSNNLLKKELWFSQICETPVSEIYYNYSGKSLLTVSLTQRGIYSSTEQACDPNSGEKSRDILVYDNSGRLAKVIRQNSISVLKYDSKGRIVEQILENRSDPKKATYTYDDKGNIIGEVNFEGTRFTYSYDNKPNPLFFIHSQPNWISPFNLSPNNLIKIESNSTAKIEYSYLSNGLPHTMKDPNGQTYEFHYE